MLLRLCFIFTRQVVGLANDNPYGLAAGVLAKDQAVIDGLVRRIRAGTVWVNTYNVYDAGEQCLSKMGTWYYAT